MMPAADYRSSALRRAVAQIVLVAMLAAPLAAQDQTEPADPEASQPAFAGMDESVNESLAEEAGVPSRDPLINTEAWGELWNLLLLGGGGICGFILGRYWDQLWGRSSRK